MDQEYQNSRNSYMTRVRHDRSLSKNKREEQEQREQRFSQSMDTSEENSRRNKHQKYRPECQLIIPNEQAIFAQTPLHEKYRPEDVSKSKSRLYGGVPAQVFIESTMAMIKTLPPEYAWDLEQMIREFRLEQSGLRADGPTEPQTFWSKRHQDPPYGDSDLKLHLSPDQVIRNTTHQEGRRNEDVSFNRDDEYIESQGGTIYTSGSRMKAAIDSIRRNAAN